MPVIASQSQEATFDSSPTSSVPRVLRGTTLTFLSSLSIICGLLYPAPLPAITPQPPPDLSPCFQREQKGLGALHLSLRHALLSCPSASSSAQSPPLPCGCCPNLIFLCVKPLVYNLPHLQTMPAQWWHNPCGSNQLMSDLTRPTPQMEPTPTLLCDQKPETTEPSSLGEKQILLV